MPEKDKYYTPFALRRFRLRDKEGCLLTHHRIYALVREGKLSALRLHEGARSPFLIKGGDIIKLTK